MRATDTTAKYLMYVVIISFATMGVLLIIGIGGNSPVGIRALGICYELVALGLLIILMRVKKRSVQEGQTS